VIRIDHVVVAVRDLDVAAERARRRLGLASVAGGRHPAWGTGNRIIPLGQQYVELLAAVDPAAAAASPVGTWVREAAAAGDRLVAWCVRTDELDPVAGRLGLAVTTGSRTLPDGRTLAWRSAGLDEVRTRPHLPFFIDWDVPAELHPGRAGADHDVKPLGISWIELSGDGDELGRWLGDAVLPVRVAAGDPAVKAVGIATERGDVVLA
jgi:hypothetical protein